MRIQSYGFLKTSKQKQMLPPFTPSFPSDPCSLQFRADRQAPVTAGEGAESVMECFLGKCGRKKELGKMEKEEDGNEHIPSHGPYFTQRHKIREVSRFSLLPSGRKATTARSLPPPNTHVSWVTHSKR